MVEMNSKSAGLPALTERAQQVFSAVSVERRKAAEEMKNDPTLSPNVRARLDTISGSPSGERI